ncbi:MAG: deoxyribonuclease IV [Firmicutes bacterium]|nr:deoxyribonuclease IV [Bacillota bacterium]
MNFGAHVSIGKGFSRAIDQAVALNCNLFQIFAGNPRGWARKPLEEGEITEFKRKLRQSGLQCVVHLSYLPNLATTDPELYQKSCQCFREDYRRANLLGADFLVFHPGKSKERAAGFAQVVGAVNDLLESIEGPTLLLFENQAGAGGEIAGDFRELGALLKEAKQIHRVGVCFDTCHAFAAGYDLRGPTAWERTLTEFTSWIDLKFLKMFHLNDAMGSIGSHLDRHQHIGEGAIGLEGFKYLVNHPELSKLPGILETPQDRPEDDLRNLAMLRKLMEK